jgi:negative modulator of initiation of replication
VLRRLHSLNPPSQNGAKKSPASPSGPQSSPQDQGEKTLREFLKSPQFLSERKAVGKFLALLALLYRENTSQFTIVEKFDGRRRKYFAQSQAELDQSGSSVNPKNLKTFQGLPIGS